VVATVRGADGAKHWREHWADLAHLGLFEMVLPDGGGSVADVAVALEQTAAALVPGPILPTVLTGLLLARTPDSPVAKELLPALGEGGVPVAVELSQGSPLVGHAPYLLTQLDGSWALLDASPAPLKGLDLVLPVSSMPSDIGSAPADRSCGRDG
jgi:alkylation response protein AidB-like acyl-CoA dehydrogenase